MSRIPLHKLQVEITSSSTTNNNVEELLICINPDTFFAPMMLVVSDDGALDNKAPTWSIEHPRRGGISEVELRRSNFAVISSSVAVNTLLN
jgi:high-affinity nickel permease